MEVGRVEVATPEGKVGGTPAASPITARRQAGPASLAKRALALWTIPGARSTPTTDLSWPMILETGMIS